MSKHDSSVTVDPMEAIISGALDSAGIAYVGENDPAGVGLDFYLPKYGVHIEVKQFHSNRISKQMEKAESVIVAQGVLAVLFLADAIKTITDGNGTTAK